MRAAILILGVAIFGGCEFADGQWPAGSRARLELVGVDQSLMPAWRSTVEWSIASWSTRINLDGHCPMPMAVSDDGDCTIRLISESEWTRDPGIVGTEHYCYIDIRGNEPSKRHAVLVHEIGHALGLDHVEDERSIMNFSVMVQEPNADDVRNARAALGCD